MSSAKGRSSTDGGTRTELEQALAEALRVAGFNDDPVDPIENQAAAILATPSMQAIARQAAIGAAVERLPERVTIRREPTGDDWEWVVIPTVSGYRLGNGTTIPAAIAAALGEDE